MTAPQTPTPRTDELQSDCREDGWRCFHRMLDHARQLERELIAERERAKELTILLSDILNQNPRYDADASLQARISEYFQSRLSAAERKDT